MKEGRVSRGREGVFGKVLIWSQFCFCAPAFYQIEVQVWTPLGSCVSWELSVPENPLAGPVSHRSEQSFVSTWEQDQDQPSDFGACESL